MNDAVQVCPTRDVECGSFPKAWCPTCPKWATIGLTNPVATEGCSVCGSTAVHACPGAPIPKWSPEKVAELHKVLGEYAEPQVGTIKDALVRSVASQKMLQRSAEQHLYPTMLQNERYKQHWTAVAKKHEVKGNQYKAALEGLDKVFVQSKAFTQIKELMAIENYDGVLAKIRTIIKEVE